VTNPWVEHLVRTDVFRTDLVAPMYMKHFLACAVILSLVAPATFLLAATTRHNKSVQPFSPSSRTFAFTYQVHVPANKDAHDSFLLWLPLPQDDQFQKVGDLRIDTPVAYTRGTDPQYGNPFVLVRPTPVQAQAGFDVTVRFHATRFEHKVSLEAPAPAKPVSLKSPPPELQRYLQADNLVPLNGVIADLARQQTAGDTTDLAKAHHIYNYVLATMRYDKSGEGWGRGDAVWACSSKRGNCTDFHSLFIGMMRASGIPARFEIGFSLPENKNDGELSGYHCWAEFYLEGTGWVPVDASEAWKNPAKRDYFFGAHDANRVFFSYGRDLQLSSEQQGSPLNYFIYPYAELDGKMVSGVQVHFSFNDLAVTFNNHPDIPAAQALPDSPTPSLSN
jgi:transglutaminase-like putative cysteine protease